MNSDSRKFARLKRILGPSYITQDREIFSDLNSLPDSLIQKACSLDNPSLSHLLLSWHTSSECHPYLALFTQEVVYGAESPSTWMRGRVLVPDWGIDDLLCRSRSVLLAPIGDKFVKHVCLRNEDWLSGATWIGAPALLQSESTYRSAIPQQVITLPLLPLEKVTDQDIVFRRWIAARLAIILRYHNLLESFTELRQLPNDLPSLKEWSNDARIAGQALLLEREELISPSDKIPGFVGPDAWYR